MPDQDRSQEEPQEGGVFGKLPAARPGVRSPRRHTEEAQPKKEAQPENPQPGPTRTDAGGRGSAPPPPTQPTAAEEPEAAERRDGQGVEDLAWAGVTVAAEAATLGVRLLSRALEAVRKPADGR